MPLGSSELKYLLAREDVPLPYQAWLFHHKVTTMAKFATLVETAAELKILLRDDMGLDAAVSIANRVLVASIQVAWNSSKSRTDKAHEVEGEYQVKKLQIPLSATDYQQMRTGWEAKFWPLEDSDIPGRSYLERRADELEHGDMRAEPLTAVLSREEDSAEVFTSYWDSAGQLQLKKGGTVVPEPGNPEVLRRRLKILFTGLMFLSLRHTNRLWLQGLTPQDAESYLSYLLGEHVWLLTGRAADGSTVSTPQWNQLLVYEHSIRKKAFHIVQTEGKTFKAAIVESYRCAVTKERFFTTPVALASVSKRPLNFQDLGNPKKWRGKGEGKGKGGGGKGEGKGKGGGKGGKGGKSGKGGKGQGKGKGGRGQSLCYAFNNSWERCTRANCPFEHACYRCGGKHPVFQCTNSEAPAGGETQGTGSV